MYSPLPSTYVSSNVLCFVNKGNKITYDIRQIAHFYNTSSAIASSGDTSALHFVLNDNASIY